MEFTMKMRLREFPFHPLFPIILSLVLFGPFLGDYFWADDLVHIEKILPLSLREPGRLLGLWELTSDDISAIWYTPRGLEIKYVRPLVNLLFLADYRIWGFSPFGFRLTNLLLHLGASLFLYLFGRRLLPEKRTALVATSLFLIYPGHLEAVWWISGRTEIVSALLYLCCLWSYMKVAGGGEENPSTRGNRIYLLPMALSFALALMAKETSATLPVSVLLLDLLVLRVDSRSVPEGSGRLQANILLWIILAGYLALRLGMGGGIGNPPLSYYHHPLAPGFLSLTLRKFIFYLMHTVFMLPMDSVFGIPFWRDHKGILILFLLLTISVLVYVAIAIRKEKAAPFLGLWFPLTLSPALLVFLGQRFLYLPSVAWCMAAALLFSVVRGKGESRRRSLAGGSLILLAIFYFLLSLGELLLYHESARRLERSVDEIASIPGLKKSGIQLYLVDLWSPLALGIAPAIRLETGNSALEVHALTLDPSFREKQVISRVTPLPAERGYSLFASGMPYLSSPAEKFFLWGGPCPGQGETFRRKGFDVTVRRGDENGLTELLVEFPARKELGTGERITVQLNDTGAEMIPSDVNTIPVENFPDP